MALLSIDDIIALEKGTTPTFDPLNSMARHIKQNQDDISALSVGSTPGWAAAVDTRWFLSATGTDAYSATPAGSPTTSDNLSDGMEWRIKFANGNTGAATLDYGTSEGAVALKKEDSAGALVALESGDIKTTHYYKVHYSAAASAFVVELHRPTTVSIKGAAGTKNLSVNPNASFPNSQIDITADEITLIDDNDEVTVISGLSVTVDLAASGKDGRGSGVTENADTWYGAWIGYDGAAAYGWLDTSATGANDPDGTNTAKLLVSAVLNNSSSNIVDFVQNGDRWDHQARFEIATGLTSTSYATQSITGGVPTAVAPIRDVLFGGYGDGAGNATVFLSDDGTNAKTIFDADDNDNAVSSPDELYDGLSASPCFIPVDGSNVHYKVDAESLVLLARAFHFNLPLG